MVTTTVAGLQECGKLHDSNRLLRQEADTLRADNIKLYEKVKFLQCYPSNSSVSIQNLMIACDHVITERCD